MASEQSRIDDIISKGRIFDVDFSHSMALSLAKAQDYTRYLGGGIIATLPELLAARARVDERHPLWLYALTANSEAGIGFDMKKGEWALLIIHGDGLLTKDVLARTTEYSDFEYTREDFRNALHGCLPPVMELYGGKMIEREIPIYSIADVIRGKGIAERKHGIVMPLMAAIDRDYPMDKSLFMQDALMNALFSGDQENMEKYFDKVSEMTGITAIKPVGKFFEEERHWINPYGYGLGLEGRTGSPIIIHPCSQPGRYVAVRD